jgi:thiamine pyrophosphate-dependent acetolactate synthase large subunit-like protein
MQMTSLEACRLISDHRADDIVVCTMGAMNAMDQLEQKPLTVACVPLMGGAASLGLGLAIARPDKKVMVLDGDASLLMELGGLVSVSQAAPSNYFHFLLNNSVQFAGLGNLPTPGRACADFRGLAEAAGYAATYHFDSLGAFAEAVTAVFAGPAPAFVELRVSSEKPTLGVGRPSVEMADARFTRMGDELRRIRNTLEFSVADGNRAMRVPLSDLSASPVPQG